MTMSIECTQKLSLTSWLIQINFVPIRIKVIKIFGNRDKTIQQVFKDY